MKKMVYFRSRVVSGLSVNDRYAMDWNETERRVEIGVVDPQENNAYRNIHITGSNGAYTITGEARVFEGTMSYAVSDGHRYLLEKFHTVDKGAPAWSAFTLDIQIPTDRLPKNGTLMLELFE